MKVSLSFTKKQNNFQSIIDCPFPAVKMDNVTRILVLQTLYGCPLIGSIMKEPTVRVKHFALLGSIKT